MYSRQMNIYTINYSRLCRVTGSGVPCAREKPPLISMVLVAISWYTGYVPHRNTHCSVSQIHTMIYIYPDDPFPASNCFREYLYMHKHCPQLYICFLQDKNQNNSWRGNLAAPSTYGIWRTLCPRENCHNLYHKIPLSKCIMFAYIFKIGR